MMSFVLIFTALSPLFSQAYTVGETSPLRRNLSFGTNHTCMKTAEDIRCWGDNRWKQSSGLFEYKNQDVKQVVAGDKGTCLIENKQVKCWGLWNKELHSKPFIVEGLNDTEQISLGQNTFCAIDGGKLQCRGNYQDHFQNAAPPLDNLIYVTVDPFERDICVIDSTAVKCWGTNTSNARVKAFLQNIKFPKKVLLNIMSAYNLCAIDGENLKCSNSNLPFTISQDVIDADMRGQHLCTLSKTYRSLIQCVYNSGSDNRSAAQPKDGSNLKSFTIDTQGAQYDHIVMGDKIVCAQGEKLDCWNLEGVDQGKVDWGYFNGEDFTSSFMELPSASQFEDLGPRDVILHAKSGKDFALTFHNFYGRILNKDEQSIADEVRFQSGHKFLACLEQMNDFSVGGERWGNTLNDCPYGETFSKLLKSLSIPQGSRFIYRQATEEYDSYNYKPVVNKNGVCFAITFYVPRKGENEESKDLDVATCFSSRGEILHTYKIKRQGIHFKIHSIAATESFQEFCVRIDDSKENDPRYWPQNVYCASDKFSKKVNLGNFDGKQLLYISDSVSCFSNNFENKKENFICTDSLRTYQKKKNNLWMWALNPDYDMDYSVRAKSVQFVHERTCMGCEPEYRDRICVLSDIGWLCQGDVFYHNEIHTMDQMLLEKDSVPLLNLSEYLESIYNVSSPAKAMFLLPMIEYIKGPLAVDAGKTLPEQNAINWCRKRLLQLIEPLIQSGTSAFYEESLVQEYREYMDKAMALFPELVTERVDPLYAELAMRTNIEVLNNLIAVAQKFDNGKNAPAFNELVNLSGRLLSAPQDRNKINELTQALVKFQPLFSEYALSSKSQFIFEIYGLLVADFKNTLGVQ